MALCTASLTVGAFGGAFCARKTAFRQGPASTDRLRGRQRRRLSRSCALWCGCRGPIPPLVYAAGDFRGADAGCRARPGRIKVPAVEENGGVAGSADSCRSCARGQRRTPQRLLPRTAGSWGRLDRGDRGVQRVLGRRRHRRQLGRRRRLLLLRERRSASRHAHLGWVPRRGRTWAC